jgi:uncharacterized RDD family membrane protein YckC
MQEKYPLLIERIQSTLIDTVLIISLMFLFSNILDKFENAPDWIRMMLFLGIWVIYEPLCTSAGFTLGNYIKGIRVRNANNSEKKINLFRALLRYIIKILLGWISFLTISSNPKRQAIHDLAAGSVMIKI